MDLPQAVLFDFSGTLMRIEPPDPWLRAVVTEAGLQLNEAEIAQWAEALETAGGHGGGAAPAFVPDYLAELWENRDFDSVKHRAAYTGFIQETGWPWPHLIDALYERSNAAEAWHPYPDALSTLATLKERGVKTGLISNIAWDARLPLEASGLLPLLDVTVLSHEVGLCKPDPAVFTLACKLLDVDPGQSVMIGDDRTADGGAQEAGLRTFFVDHLPVDQRPSALADILDQIIRP